MDSRTVYGYWSQDLDGYGDRFVCGRTVKCRNTAQCASLERCEEKVLVDPASFAKVEDDARVGRAVEEWLDGPAHFALMRLKETSQGGYYAACVDLRTVIAKAREESR